MATKSASCRLGLKHTAIEQGNAPTTALVATIAELGQFDLSDLRTRYRQLTRKSAPPHIPRWLLLSIVAHRLQVQALGDLDNETARLLAETTRAHQAELIARTNAEAAGLEWQKRRVPIVAAVAPEIRDGFDGLALGTELVRDHGDELHRVTVTKNGYLWDGQLFTSLSQLAKNITGTTWNGRVFFGLKSRDKKGCQVRDKFGSEAKLAVSNVHTRTAVLTSTCDAVGDEASAILGPNSLISPDMHSTLNFGQRGRRTNDGKQSGLQRPNPASAKPRDQRSRRKPRLVGSSDLTSSDVAGLAIEYQPNALAALPDPAITSQTLAATPNAGDRP